MILRLTVLAVVAGAVEYRVAEDSPPHSLIGHVAGPSTSTNINYLIVYPDDATEEAIRVDDRNGEIRVRTELDYEKKNRYDILAVPLAGGEGITVTVTLIDVNDNSPLFPRESISLEMSELAEKGSHFAIPSAEDRDSPPFDVQSYTIVRGNVNNVFRLHTHRIEGKLLVEMEVNGELDREYRESYDLIIEAKDGGDPPRRGEQTVRVTLLDVNDNFPSFSQHNYTVVVQSNHSSSLPIVRVAATDADDSATITYRLSNVRSDSAAWFDLSSNGSLYMRGSIEPGRYDMVVVASDGGNPPLETNAWIFVTIEPRAHTTAQVDIVWLTASGEGSLSESTTLGSIIARLSLNSPDPSIGLKLMGSSCVCVRETDQLHIYLLSVCAPLDRESSPQHNLLFTIEDNQSNVLLEHPVVIKLFPISDVNDNAPVWPASAVTIRLNRSRDDYIDLSASDGDTGDNARITYSLQGTNHLLIDPDTGKVRLAHSGCAALSPVVLRVTATDHGVPPLSASLQVTAEIVQSPSSIRCSVPFHETTLREDMAIGHCFIQIGTESDDGACGSSGGRVRYSLKGKNSASFRIDTRNGNVCVRKQLDYETTPHYDLVMEVSQEGSEEVSDRCLLSVRVEDINDNAPVFSPILYKSTMKEDDLMKKTSILRVKATDIDSGVFGQVEYKLMNTSNGLFHLNSSTGMLQSTGRVPLGVYRLEAVAIDGGHRESIETAILEMRVLSSSAVLPDLLQKSVTTIVTSEDILPGIDIGAVNAVANGILRYSIYSGDADHYFSLEGDTGRLSVVNYLDADKNPEVLLNIQISPTTGESIYAQVLVQIEDHNDNPPEFSSETLLVRVREDHPMERPFYIVAAHDKDHGKNGLVTYSMVSCVPDGPFALHPISGDIRLTAPLDYERVREYRVRVKAVDGGIPSKTAHAFLNIQLIDVNDNRPLFQHNTYAITIVENNEVGLPIGDFKATDSDTGSGGRVEYSLSGEDSFLFSLDPRTGELYSKEPLDREYKALYNLTLSASDKGTPRLSSSVPVLIEVLDENDNSPSCSSIQPITVTPSHDTRNAIGTIVGEDKDGGVNGTLSYRLNTFSPYFAVRATGEVFVRRELEGEEGKKISLTVLLNDGGSPSKSTLCQVTIYVSHGEPSISMKGAETESVYLSESCVLPCPLITVNATGVARWKLQSSEISSSLLLTDEGTLMQTAPIGIQAIRHVNVVMEDENGRQKIATIRIHPHKRVEGELFHLLASLPLGTRVWNYKQSDQPLQEEYFIIVDKSGEMFDIDASQGILYLTDSLESLAGENVMVTVGRKRVSGETVSERRLVFEVEDDLPARASFPSTVTRVALPESTPFGTVIHKMRANSTDYVIPRYSIVDREGILYCDPITGEIILQKALQPYAGSELYVAASAEIGGIESGTLLLLTIEDDNDHAPLIMSSAEVRLDESREENRPFHHVVAMDSDHGANALLQYSLVGNNTHFSIDKLTGALSVLSRLGEDEWLVVRVSDGGTPPLHTDQTLHVVAALSKWRYFDRSSVSIPLHTNSPQHVLTRIPSSDDVTIHLLPSNVPFELKNGELKAKGMLKEKVYNMKVVAENENGEIDWMSLCVSMGEEDTPPPQISTISCQTVLVPENTRMERMKTIVASSRGANATFKIKSGNEESLFTMNATSGEISCVELDREKKREHLILIALHDSLNQDSCSLRVVVDDRNDNPPLLTTRYREIVIDDQEEGRTILTLEGEDPDEGDNGRIQYELLQDPCGLFDVTAKGEIVFARNIACKRSEWNISIRLFDQGTEHSMDSIWDMAVKDNRKREEREDLPRFIRPVYYSSVQEDRPKGMDIATVEINKRDAHPTYSIVRGNVDQAFDIDSHGKITTARELDREIRKKYNLTVIAASTALPNSRLTTMVIVNVLNANDNPPTIHTPTRRKISEATPVGTYITTITATDVDDGTVLQYSLTEQSSSSFVVDRLSGVIHLSAPLDYEYSKQENIIIAVSDGKHTSTTSLAVTVVDENDNSPVFSSPLYDFVLPSSDDHSVGGKVVASDADSEERAHIEFSIISNQSIPFKIDRSTGKMTLTSSSEIDRREYVFCVAGTDGGSPPRQSTVPVRIRIREPTTASPSFTHPFYRFEHPENYPKWSKMGRIETSPSGPNRIHILDPQLSAIFAINSHGEIFAKQSLDREQRPSYQFNIEIEHSRGSRHANSTATVIVNVLDDNDNAPVFGHTDNVTIHEKMQEGEPLLQLSVTDRDEGENGTVTYRIVTGNDYSVLSLDESSGSLSFHEWSDVQLLSLSSPSWEVTILAEDNGSPRRSSLHSLTVSVLRQSWSGTAPFFPLPSYHLYIREDAPLGTVVHKMRAVTRFGVPVEDPSFSLHDHNTQLFSMNKRLGVLSTVGRLDYEEQDEHLFSLSVEDRHSRSSVASVIVHVLPVDEFPPIFSRLSYAFKVPKWAEAGYSIGKVDASDKDRGSDGTVSYRMSPTNTASSIEVVASTGELRLTRAVDRDRNTSFTLIASSGHLQQSSVMVLIEYGEVSLPQEVSLLRSAAFIIGLLLTLFIILLIILIACVCVRYGRRNNIDRSEKQVYTIKSGSNNKCGMPLPGRVSPFVSPSRPATHERAGAPRDIPSSRSQPIQERAGAPRDIPSSRSQPDSGIDPDNCSINSSITEYLASIGVSRLPRSADCAMGRRDDESADEQHINDLIYAKVDEILTPGPLNLSHNFHIMDDMMPSCVEDRKRGMTVPPFQPLADILKQIDSENKAGFSSKKDDVFQITV